MRICIKNFLLEKIKEDISNVESTIIAVMRLKVNPEDTLEDLGDISCNSIDISDDLKLDINIIYDNNIIFELVSNIEDLLFNRMILNINPFDMNLLESLDLYVNEVVDNMDSNVVKYIKKELNNE